MQSDSNQNPYRAPTHSKPLCAEVDRPRLAGAQRANTICAVIYSVLVQGSAILFYAWTMGGRRFSLISVLVAAMPILWAAHLISQSKRPIDALIGVANVLLAIALLWLAWGTSFRYLVG